MKPKLQPTQNNLREPTRREMIALLNQQLRAQGHIRARWR